MARHKNQLFVFGGVLRACLAGAQMSSPWCRSTLLDRAVVRIGGTDIVHRAQEWLNPVQELSKTSCLLLPIFSISRIFMRRCQERVGGMFSLALRVGLGQQRCIHDLIRSQLIKQTRQSNRDLHQVHKIVSTLFWVRGIKYRNGRTETSADVPHSFPQSYRERETMNGKREQSPLESPEAKRLKLNIVDESSEYDSREDQLPALVGERPWLMEQNPVAHLQDKNYRSVLRRDQGDMSILFCEYHDWVESMLRTSKDGA